MKGTYVRVLYCSFHVVFYFFLYCSQNGIFFSSFFFHIDIALVYDPCIPGDLFYCASSIDKYLSLKIKNPFFFLLLAFSFFLSFMLIDIAINQDLLRDILWECVCYCVTAPVIITLFFCSVIMLSSQHHPSFDMIHGMPSAGKVFHIH